MNEADETKKLVPTMLSTSDNPFNPFTDFEDWYNFDESHEYHTLTYLARVCDATYDISDALATLAINTAVEEAAQLNLTGNRIVVTDPASE